MGIIMSQKLTTEVPRNCLVNSCALRLLVLSSWFTDTPLIKLIDSFKNSPFFFDVLCHWTINDNLWTIFTRMLLSFHKGTLSVSVSFIIQNQTDSFNFANNKIYDNLWPKNYIFSEIKSFMMFCINIYFSSSYFALSRLKLLKLWSVKLSDM